MASFSSSQTFDSIDKIRSLPCLSFSDRLRLPQKSGIYFAFSAAQSLIYIGISTHLRGRWGQHKNFGILNDSKDYGPLTIYYSVQTSYSGLHSIEDKLIKLYCPPMNIKNTVFSHARIPVDQPHPNQIKFEVQFGDAIFTVEALSPEDAVQKIAKAYLPTDPPVVLVRASNGAEYSLLIYDYLE